MLSSTQPHLLRDAFEDGPGSPGDPRLAHLLRPARSRSRPPRAAPTTPGTNCRIMSPSASPSITSTLTPSPIPSETVRSSVSPDPSSSHTTPLPDAALHRRRRDEERVLHGPDRDADRRGKAGEHDLVGRHRAAHARGPVLRDLHGEPGAGERRRSSGDGQRRLGRRVDQPVQLHRLDGPERVEGQRRQLRDLAADRRRLSLHDRDLGDIPRDRREDVDVLAPGRPASR